MAKTGCNFNAVYGIIKVKCKKMSFLIKHSLETMRYGSMLP
jgi:hypothetical protein